MIVLKLKSSDYSLLRSQISASTQEFFGNGPVDYLA